MSWVVFNLINPILRPFGYRMLLVENFALRTNPETQQTEVFPIGAKFELWRVQK